MAHPVRANETVAHAVRRIVRTALDDAGRQLADPEVEFADRIHALRTAIKKARAMARAVRPEVRRARKASRRLRKIARSVGDAREAHVLLSTLDDLVRDWPGERPDPLRKLRTHFAVRLDETERAFEIGFGFRKLRRKLARARRRTKQWTKVGDTWDSLGPGLAQQYHLARERMAQAYQQPSGDAFHTWRRSVKSLRHQLHALMDLWPDELPKRVKKLDRLGDELGAEHDLTVLEDVLANTQDDVVDAATRAELVARLDRRRDQRRNQAKALGAQLFREGVRPFERRLKSAFESARGKA